MKRVRNFWKLQFYWVIPSFIVFALCKRVKFVLGSILQSHSEQPSSSYCSSDRRRKSAWETCWDNSLQKNIYFPEESLCQSLIQATSFPSDTSGKDPTWQFRRCKKQGFDLWIQRITWRRAWQPTPVFLPEEFHGQRSPVGYTPYRIAKSWTWLSTHTCIPVTKENSSHSPKLSFLN